MPENINNVFPEFQGIHSAAVRTCTRGRASEGLLGKSYKSYHVYFRFVDYVQRSTKWTKMYSSGGLFSAVERLACAWKNGGHSKRAHWGG